MFKFTGCWPGQDGTSFVIRLSKRTVSKTLKNPAAVFVVLYVCRQLKPYLLSADKGKGKLIRILTMNTYRGSRNIAPLILNLCTT
jgi:hypothetical protein